MMIFRKYYNLFVLLICVGAFPIAVVASSNLNHDDSLLCTFHNDQPVNNTVIVCDHWSFFFDILVISSFFPFIKIIFVEPSPKLLKLLFRLSLIISF